MSVKLKIEELGRIRNSEIELKPLMVFSGKSSLGKSYTAFLIYSLMDIFFNQNIYYY